jgi:hypothetical protein
MTVAQADNIKPVQLEGKRPAAAKPAAKPVVEEVEDVVEAVAEEVVDEPAKRKAAAKPTAVPKKSGSLASVVADWDADDE